MNIKGMRIEWLLGYDNPPGLVVEVDKLPPFSELVYRKAPSGHYLAEHPSGYVRYFHWVQPDEGYGGRVFNITLDTGEQLALKGPWSSRAGAVNADPFGFPQIVDVAYKELDEDLRHCMIAGAMTLAVAKAVMRQYLPDMEFWVDHPVNPTAAVRKVLTLSAEQCVLGDMTSNDLRYTPTFKGQTPKQSKERMNNLPCAWIRFTSEKSGVMGSCARCGQKRILLRRKRQSMKFWELELHTRNFKYVHTTCKAST